MSSPCKECEFRHAWCHANCVIYRDYAMEKSKERAYTSKEREALAAMWDYIGRYLKK